MEDKEVGELWRESNTTRECRVKVMRERPTYELEAIVQNLIRKLVEERATAMWLEEQPERGRPVMSYIPAALRNFGIEESEWQAQASK